MLTQGPVPAHGVVGVDLAFNPSSNPMTARRVLRTTARSQSARPADSLIQKPMTTWFAEWKARTSGQNSSPARQPSATATMSA